MYCQLCVYFMLYDGSIINNSCTLIPGKKQQELEAKLASLEEQCKDNEKSRVDLELQLSEVKENLKKSLAGGPSLGLAVTGKPENPVSRPRCAVS